MFKNISLIIALITTSLFLSSNVTAQRISVGESEMTLNERPQSCVEVTLEPEVKEVKKAFKDFMDDNYDVNLKGIGFLSNKDVLTAEQVNIPTVSNKTMDLSAKVIEVQDKTQMCVAGSFGYDIAIDQADYYREYRSLRGIVLDFLDGYLPEYYQNRVDEKAEVVADLKDERQDLNEDIADNEEEIEKLKKENEDLRKELDQTKKDLETQTANLEKRRNSLEEVNKELSRNKE
ncbi:MAG: hypothetical protein AB8G22_17985 [Saprospiraceae bacterium]